MFLDAAVVALHIIAPQKIKTSNQLESQKTIKMKKTLMTSSVAALAALCFCVTAQAQKGQGTVKPDTINLNSSKSNIYRAQASPTPAKPAKKVVNLNSSKSNAYRTAQPSPTPRQPAKATNLNLSRSNRVASPAMVRAIYRFKVDHVNVNDDFIPLVE